MPSKKAKLAIAAVKSSMRHWTFEVKGTFNPKGTSDFIGKLKDDKGRVIMTIKEDDDFNQLSRLLNTSKYMRAANDMKGLAEYVWDRNLVLMEEEEKESWKKKRVIPLNICMIPVV
jgi:hypothetical protein